MGTLREGANFPKNVDTEENIKLYTFALLEESVGKLALSITEEVAHNFSSISEIKDLNNLDKIESFFENKLKGMQSTLKIYKEKIPSSGNIENAMVEKFISVVQDKDKSLDESKINTVSDISEIIFDAISRKRKVLEKNNQELEQNQADEKEVQNKPVKKEVAKSVPVLDVKVREKQPVTFQFGELHGDVKARLKKIAKKRTMQSAIHVTPVSKEEWGAHLDEVEKRITKLSGLEEEKNLNLGKYTDKYMKAKYQKGANKVDKVKYAAQERFKNYEVKRRLYKDMQFSKGAKDSSYNIKEMTGNKCTMDVLTTYTAPNKEVAITANVMDNEDHYILTMVEQARGVVKQFAEHGKDPKTISITITNCEARPETAIKLQEALRILNIEGIYDRETEKAVERYHNDSRNNKNVL